ncbi:hypothetical protein K1Y10_24645, partial [Escherichia coli]|nr:hypothetical protein [Escherichia coli]
ADMADVCQPAAFVIPPPLCGFAIHGAVREAVCFVIVPVGDQPISANLRVEPSEECDASVPR